MEPLFFKAENVRSRVLVAVRNKTFNGAAFFQSGKYEYPNASRSAMRCAFNGAAFFQSGKSAGKLEKYAKGLEPSMEPLFFKAENAELCPVLRLARSPFNGAAFFQSGKCSPVLRTTVPVKAPSMEPLFFKAENVLLVTCPLSGAETPSMEPLFFKAENPFSRHLVGSRLESFNGAAFFQSGKSVLGSRKSASRRVPSMEPLFFKAENLAGIDTQTHW